MVNPDSATVGKVRLTECFGQVRYLRDAILQWLYIFKVPRRSRKCEVSKFLRIEITII